MPLLLMPSVGLGLAILTDAKVIAPSWVIEEGYWPDEVCPREATRSIKSLVQESRGFCRGARQQQQYHASQDPHE